MSHQPAGETSLLLAVDRLVPPDAELLSELVGGGVDVNATSDGPGLSALWFAVSHGHASTVRALLDLGASPKQTSRSGTSPRDLASLRRMHDIVQMLDEASSRWVAAVTLQAAGRSWLWHWRRGRAAATLQAAARGRAARRRLRQHQAAVVLQSAARGIRARRQAEWRRKRLERLGRRLLRATAELALQGGAHEGGVSCRPCAWLPHALIWMPRHRRHSCRGSLNLWVWPACDRWWHGHPFSKGWRRAQAKARCRSARGVGRIPTAVNPAAATRRRWRGSSSRPSRTGALPEAWLRAGGSGSCCCCLGGGGGQSLDSVLCGRRVSQEPTV
jgi:hypothetical protein